MPMIAMGRAMASVRRLCCFFFGVWCAGVFVLRVVVFVLVGIVVVFFVVANVRKMCRLCGSFEKKAEKSVFCCGCEKCWLSLQRFFQH